jgi:hypothetical protein
MAFQVEQALYTFKEPWSACDLILYAGLRGPICRSTYIIVMCQPLWIGGWRGSSDVEIHARDAQIKGLVLQACQELLQLELMIGTKFLRAGDLTLCGLDHDEARLPSFPRNKKNAPVRSSSTSFNRLTVSPYCLHVFSLPSFLFFPIQFSYPFCYISIHSTSTSYPK